MNINIVILNDIFHTLNKIFKIFAPALLLFHLQAAYANNFKHSEASYQIEWCKIHNGILEYKNPDFTRVDCLTDTHATEFDFAKKWAESVGQALYYGLVTGKKAKVVLILVNPGCEMMYYERIQKLSKKYNFDIEYVTNEILKLDKNGKCKNIKCRCHKARFLA